MSVEPQKPQGSSNPPFIATAPALESLALLDRALGTREPFVLVTGDSGVGKSTLVREALRRWGARVCDKHLPATEATAETVFATLLGRFGGTTNSQASSPALAQRLVEAIVHAASGGRVVMVVVDDAHKAAPELLLQLANVADMVRRRQCAFEVLLVGTPELSARLSDPALATLAAKVSAQIRLSPLTQHDTRHYLLQRSGHEGASGSAGMFSRKASRDIHGATFGIPREIEALADESARRAARANTATISPEHVRSATQALRARRGNTPTTTIASRAERMNPAAPPVERAASATPAPRPANPAPTPRPANPTAPPTATNGANSAPVRPQAPKPAAAAPAPTAGMKAPAAGPAKPNVGAASTSAATKPAESSDQRIKDWVSRFGGSGGVRIGVGHGMPRYEESATLDVPAPPPSTTNRILIVDEEPKMPPELVARLNKLTRKKRRRGPSTTIQGAALAIAVALLVVLLARQAGFGRRLGVDSADTSARAVAGPESPPLALGTRVETGPTHKVGTPVERRLRPNVDSQVGSQPSEPAARSKSRPAPKRLVASAPAEPETLPPLPLQVGTSASAQTGAPVVGSEHIDDQPASVSQRFGIIAGSFPSNDMAKAEKDHLARLTSYRVWVIKTKVNGVRTYELMVGRFDSMAHAWDSAQTLMRRGLIRDGGVRPLSEREAR